MSEEQEDKRVWVMAPLPEDAERGVQAIAALSYLMEREFNNLEAPDRHLVAQWFYERYQ